MGASLWIVSLFSALPCAQPGRPTRYRPASDMASATAHQAINPCSLDIVLLDVA